MKINTNIHPKNHVLKHLLGKLEYAATHLRLNERGLYVVNYHGTQRQFLPNLKKQLHFFKSHFSILSPDQLSSFYKAELSNGPYLLITFDDGIKNNLLAADLLDELHIKALFFIVPEFIQTPPEKQKEYFIRCIRPVINPRIDQEKEDFEAMNWSDLRGLQSAGHGIGSHTLTHTLVATTSSVERSKNEISGSKEMIRSKLYNDVDCFCSINNTLESIGEKELSLIKAHYTFHFTTIPGVNLPTSDRYYIKRCNIESHWLPGAVKYALGSWDLKRWKNADEAYAKLLGK